MTLQGDLQRLTGTKLDAQGAANVWAGTTGRDLLGALNAKAGTTGVGMNKVMQTITGRSGEAGSILDGYSAGSTYTIYADASDGYGFATTAFAATAASVGAAGLIYAGQEVGGFYEGFVQFDTSSVVGTVTSVTLSLYGNGDFSGGVDTWEVRAHDWGTTLETTDWVSRANQPSLTLVATKAGAISTSSYNAFASDPAFLSAINKTGFTRLLINSLRHRTSVAPAGAEYVRFESRDTGGTTTGPKLVVVTG